MPRSRLDLRPDGGGPSSIVFNYVDRQYIHVVDGSRHSHADLLADTADRSA
jgi:hypothetical protein